MNGEICNCPCCREGIEAPHEYHLEPRRAMPAPVCKCGAECQDLRDGCRYRTAGAQPAAAPKLSELRGVLRPDQVMPRDDDGVLGTEQIHPFWCHEQSHDRPRCITQCSECADDGDGVRVPSAPRFDKTYCSQCGGEFGPGDEGYSHCKDHQREATNDLQA